MTNHKERVSELIDELNPTRDELNIIVGILTQRVPEEVEYAINKIHESRARARFNEYISGLGKET